MSEKEKILIADDSAMNRAILTEMLGDGYEILEAENGRQAVAILQSCDGHRPAFARYYDARDGRL